jgi:hypothetical protein
VVIEDCERKQSQTSAFDQIPCHSKSHSPPRSSAPATDHVGESYVKLEPSRKHSYSETDEKDESCHPSERGFVPPKKGRRGPKPKWEKV